MLQRPSGFFVAFLLLCFFTLLFAATPSRANEEEVSLDVPEEWNIVVKGDTFNEKGIEKVKGKVKVPRLSMLVGFRK